MTVDLSGKVAVVTGGARGQGAAIVASLARHGAAVIAVDILADRGAAMASALSGEGLDVEFVVGDVASESLWAQLLDRIGARHGRLDALVNNAAVNPRDRLPTFDLHTLNRTLAVNLQGPMVAARTLLPLLGPGSSIVNVLSTAALGAHTSASYAISKWALRGLTRVEALEFGPRGIRCNALIPGFIETEMTENASDSYRRAVSATVPLGRGGRVEETVGAVNFLVSDDATYLNGAEIVVDGGLTSHTSHKALTDA